MAYLATITGSLAAGVKYTLGVFAITVVLSLPLGLGMTFLRTSKSCVLRSISGFYVWIMRGTPLLLQLYFFYYGLAFIPGLNQFLTMDRYTAACVAFVLNYAAYFCEIFRGGLLSIDKGQYEVSHVLGLNSWQTMTRVIIPQMIRVTLPSIGNEAITLVKDTALVASIALPELLHYAKGIVTRDFTTTPFLVAAFIYLLITFVVTLLFKFAEKKTNYD